MDFDPTLLFILIFILAPLLERLFKAGKQRQPPEQGPPPRRVPPPRPRPHERPRPTEEPQPLAGSRAETEGSPAADMLPDDLWEILTGQRRERPPAEPPRAEQPAPRAEPSRQPLPRPGSPAERMARRRQQQQAQAREQAQARASRLPPAQQRRLPEVSMRTEVPEDEEARLPRRVSAPDSFPIEGYVREIPTHVPPEVVSLEELTFDDEQRHASFHKRVSEFDAPARVMRTPQHELVRLLRRRDDVRRAIILNEVLGPPRGLE